MTRQPKYCGPHNPSGLGYVWKDGKPHYFKGHPHGSPESLQMYAQYCFDLEQSNGSPKRASKAGTVPSVAQLINAYRKRKDGAKHYHDDVAIDLLKKNCPQIPASDFGPLALQAIRSQMVSDGQSRNYTNQIIQRVRKIFRWGVSQEIVPVEVHTALESVEGLRKGHTEARETDPVEPVDWADVEPVIPAANPVVAAMIQLHWWTGMRPQNVTTIRPMDVDTTESVWIYRPDSHKTAHRGRQLTIFLGPQSQEAITGFLNRPADKPLFSPKESWPWKVEAICKGSEIHFEWTNRKCKSHRRMRKSFDTGSYRQAVHRALRRLNKLRDSDNQVEHWSPNQIRHTRGTAIRKEFGVEAAQVFLGHARADVTQVYAERDLELGLKIARDIG